VFVIFKLLTGDKRKKEQLKDKDVASKVSAGEMVKDPVCGTFVPGNAEIRVRSGEKVYCFCSYQCRDKYLKQLEAARSVEEDSRPEAS
jgi:YHS domain-containing protein